MKPLVLALVALALPRSAEGGPPYLTDDPEPAPFRHWEVYVASQDAWARDAGWTGTAPHLEVNYGAWPDAMLHAIVPANAWARPPGGPVAFGYGDTELGLKLRFVHEGDRVPQVGTFPLVELPTGDAARGLGGGHVQAFFPLWVQKSFGRWTTYGGGGFWLRPGAGNRNGWFVGWQAQRELRRGVSLGAELVHESSPAVGERGSTLVNVGVVLDFGELQHLLASAGGGLDGRAAQAYLAYQLTFGPGGER